MNKQPKKETDINFHKNLFLMGIISFGDLAIFWPNIIPRGIQVKQRSRKSKTKKQKERMEKISSNQNPFQIWCAPSHNARVLNPIAFNEHHLQIRHIITIVIQSKYH